MADPFDVPFGDLTVEQKAGWLATDPNGYIEASYAWAFERAREDVEAEMRRRFRADVRKAWARVRRILWPFGGRRG